MSRLPLKFDACEVQQYVQLQHFLNSVLAKSSGRRPQKKSRGKGRNPAHSAAQRLEGVLARPVQLDSKGGQMLQALGWQEGQGIGARMQGRLEPLMPLQRKHLLGLGAE